MIRDFTIGLLGVGEVGVKISKRLGENGYVRLAYDKRPVDVQQPKLTFVDSASELAKQADLIISAVTAEETERAAKSVAADIKESAFFVDLNSAAPVTKIAAAQHITIGGGRYVEAAIMSPIDPKGMKAPILLGGPHAGSFALLGEQLGFTNLSVYADEYGRAAATKLCRSVVIKGFEALLIEAMMAARAYGVVDAVLSSLDNLFPRPDWPGHARYMISRAILHGDRRAEEMRETASALRSVNITPTMTEGAVKRQSQAAGLLRRLPDETSLSDLLDVLLDH